MLIAPCGLDVWGFFFLNVEGGGKYSNHSTLKVTHLTFQLSETHV